MHANSIPTKSDVVWIGIAVGAVGAGIGIGIYYAVHHDHSLTGCAVSGASDIELQSQGDQQTYALAGAVNAIKPGERIRVSGKRVKKTAGPTPQFLVEQLRSVPSETFDALGEWRRIENRIQTSLR
jgi:hypothetical protein